MSEFDYLTKTKLRNFAEGLINNLVRKKIEFSLLFIDIDNFKVINDIYGHTTGDKVLAEFAKELSSHLRKIDSLARYGGDEFIIIVPKASKKDAEKIANRLLKAIETKRIASFKISFSFGIANFPSDGNTFDNLIDEADKKLYEMKISGSKELMRFSVAQRESIKAYGREKERRVILEHIKKTLSSKGQLAVISGPIGIGKTFLAKKIILETEDLFKNVINVNLTINDLKNSFSFFKNLLSSEMERKLEEKLKNFEDFSKVANFEEIVFESITQIIKDKAKEGPIIFFVENIEFIDSLSYSFLGKFLSRIANCKIIILATFKGVPDSRFNSLSAYENFSIVHLKHLPLVAIKMIITDLLGNLELEESLLNLLYEKSQGNPYFLYIIIKSLIEKGLIIETKNGIALKETTEPSFTIDFEGSIESILKGLNKDEINLLSFLSIASDNVDSLVVSKIIQELGPQFMDTYDSLISKGILYEEDNLIKFKFPVIKETLRKKLTEVRKKTILRIIAKVNEEIGSKKFLENTYENYMELGDKEQAKRILILLGQKNEEAFNLIDAANRFEQALELSEDKNERELLLKEVIILLTRLSRGEEVIKIFEKYGSERINDNETMLNLADAYETIGNFKTALKLLSEIKTSSYEIASRAILLKSWIIYEQGNISKASELINKLNLKKITPYTLALYFNLKGIYYLEDNNFEKAIEVFEEGLKVAEKHRKETFFSIKNNIANAKLALGYFEDALKLLEEVVLDSRKFFNIHIEAIATYNIGDAMMAIGNFKEAPLYYEMASKLSKSTNNLIGIGYGFLGQGYSKLSQGKLDEAEKNTRKALYIFKKLGAEREIETAYASLINIYFLKNKIDRVLCILSSVKIGIERETGVLLLINAVKILTKMKENKKVKKYDSMLKKALEKEFDCITKLKLYSILADSSKLLGNESDFEIFKNKALMVVSEISDKFKSESNKQLFLNKPDYI